MNEDWTPRNKYEVAPGLFIGSEIGDIDREIKVLTKQWLDSGDKMFLRQIKSLQDRRMELMKPKRIRKSETDDN